MRIYICLPLAILLSAPPACKSDGGAKDEKAPAPSEPLAVTWSESGDSFELSNGAKGRVATAGMKYRIQLESSAPMSYSIQEQKGATDATFEVDLGVVMAAAKISEVSYLAPTELLRLGAGDQSLDVKLLGLNYRDSIPSIFAAIKDGPILFPDEAADEQVADSALWLHKDLKVSWEVLGKRGTFADIDWIAETQREEAAADRMECEGYQFDSNQNALVPMPDAKVSFEVYNTRLFIRDRRSGKELHNLALAPAKTCPERAYAIDKDGQQMASIYLLPDEIEKAITDLLAAPARTP